MIMPQVDRMPIAAKFRTISNASAGTTKLRPTPSTQIPLVSRILPYGTWLRLITDVNRGAEPDIAMERRMRPVEYRPELSEDMAAVRTTRFITPPAAGMPMLDRTVTKGLSLPVYLFQGSSIDSRSTEPT